MRHTMTATSGRMVMTIRRLMSTSLPNLPFKMSQKSDQRLVGRVLRAYSSLRSFPSSQRAMSPFFSLSAIILSPLSA